MTRRLSLTSVLAAALLILVAAPSFAWKFVSMADSRGSRNGVNTKELLRLIDRVNAEQPDLVIFQGDAVSGTTSDTALSSQMNTWLATMSRLKCPWYYTPGNHELQTRTAQEDVLRTKVDQPMNGPDGDKEMTYSFDHEKAHFVALNGYRYGKAHHLQMDWLRNDLTHTKQLHIFVMSHDPAFPAGPHKGSSLDAYPKERNDLWRLMTEEHVGMYFCGHEHLYQRSKHGMITQVINGSCGAPLYTGVPDAIDKYQYVVVEIEGSHVTCATKDDEGKTIDSWSYEAR